MPRWVNYRRHDPAADSTPATESGRSRAAASEPPPIFDGSGVLTPKTSHGGDRGWTPAWPLPIDGGLDGKARRALGHSAQLAHGISGRVAVVRPHSAASPRARKKSAGSTDAPLSRGRKPSSPASAAEFIAAFDDVLAAADADRAPAVAGVEASTRQRTRTALRMTADVQVRRRSAADAPASAAAAAQAPHTRGHLLVSQLLCRALPAR